VGSLKLSRVVGETDSEPLSGLASFLFDSGHIRFSIYLSLIIAFIEMGSSKRVLQDVSLFYEGTMVSGPALTV
jgi:hypothetical protein